MKKTLFSIALLSAGLALAPMTFAQDAQPNTSGNYQSGQPIGSGNWTIDLGVGRTTGYSDGNNGFGTGFGSGSGSLFSNSNGRRTGYNVNAGYRWKIGPDMGLGLDAGYVDLGNYKISNLGTGSSVNQSSTTNALRGWTLGGNGRINLMPQWYLSARGGYFHANNNGGAYNDSLHQDLFHGGGRGGYYGGVGTGWDINNHFGVGVNYDYYHVSAGRIHNVPSDTDFAVRRSTGIVSLSGEYRF